MVVIVLRSYATIGKGRENKIILGYDKSVRYVREDVSCSRAEPLKKCGCSFNVRVTPLSPPVGIGKSRLVMACTIMSRIKRVLNFHSFVNSLVEMMVMLTSPP